MTVSKRNLVARILRLSVAVFVWLSGTLPAQAAEINIFTPTYELVNQSSYSNQTFTPDAGEYSQGIIANDLNIYYNAYTTSNISGTAVFDTNILDLAGNRTFSQTSADPIAATRLTLNNNYATTPTDLSGLSFTIQNNTLNVTYNSTDLSDAKGNIIGSLVEANNSNIGTLTLTNNTVNSAVDTHSDGTQIIGAEIISNATGYNSSVVLNQNVDANNVNIQDGTINNDVIGGKILATISDNASDLAVSGNVQNNIVTIEKGTINRSVTGGLLTVDSQNESHTLNVTGSVQGNQLVIKDGVYNGSVLTGGSIFLEGYKAKNDSVLTATVQNNIIDISGGTFYGGYIIGGATVADNKGATVSGDISGNVIEISGNTVFNGTPWLSGGFTNGTNDYTANTLILHTAGLNTYGVDGFNNYQVDLTNASNGTVYLEAWHGNGHNNALFSSFNMPAVNGAWNVDGATVEWASYGRPTALGLGATTTLLKENGGFGLSGTLANADEIQSFTEGDITYTYQLRQRQDRVDVLHTKLATTADWSQDIAFGAGNYSGDDITMQIDGNLTAKNITVVSNSTAKANLTAGTLDLTANSAQLNLQANQDGNLNATFNTIKIGDGYSLTKSGNALYTFTNMQMDGNAQVNSLDVSGNAATATLGSAVNAHFNTINLADGANLTIDTSSGATYAFDTLNSYGTGNTFSGDLDTTNKAMNFFLADVTAANDTALNVTGTADVTNSTVQVGILGSSSALKLDDQVVLVDAGTLTGVPSTTSGVGMQGLMIKYNFDLAAVGNQLIATVTNTQLSENAKAFSEGRMAASTLINQGTDFAANDSMVAAQQAATLTPGIAVFSTLGGGKSRYKTGSHVDVTGFSAAVGLSHEVKYWFGADWLLGSFIEYGNGHYNTHNTFFSGDVKGKGDSQYIGLGVLGRRKAQNNTYLEVSARIGQSKTDFKGPVYNSNYASYDYTVPYYGAHAGVGYIWEWAADASLDLSAKYLWTYQDKKSVTISTGDVMDFGKLTSNRARVGAELNLELAKPWSSYFGLAYDYEFSGKATATTYGMTVAAPKLEGGTAIAQIGLRYEFEQFLLSLGAEGYAGKRRGASGNIRFGFMF